MHLKHDVGHAKGRLCAENHLHLFGCFDKIPTRDRWRDTRSRTTLHMSTVYASRGKNTTRNKSGRHTEQFLQRCLLLFFALDFFMQCLHLAVTLSNSVVQRLNCSFIVGDLQIHHVALLCLLTHQQRTVSFHTGFHCKQSKTMATLYNYFCSHNNSTTTTFGFTFPCLCLPWRIETV